MAGDHFYTITVNEREAALASYGYQDDGVAGYVFGFPASQTIPLYRLLNPNNGDHFYTTSQTERSSIIAGSGYQDEGIACFVYSTQAPQTIPLYRLLNLDNGDHFYTTSPTDRDQLLSIHPTPPPPVERRPSPIPPRRTGNGVTLVNQSQGYRDEGITCYLYGTQVEHTLPLYRLFQDTGTTPPPRRIKGFADVHNHQFANLAFGGKAFVGAAFGPIDQALPHCDFGPGNSLLTPNWVHGPGGTRDFLGTIRSLTSGIGGVGHLVGGYPEFDGWPRWNNLTHQAVHQDWLWRAFEGGLKLLVVLAVNNELVCDQVEKAPGRTSDDMEAVDLQIGAAQQMEAYVDELSGGPGQGWYRIVYSPQQARQVINAGKLAVVLGIEVDNLFGNKADQPVAPEDLLARLNHYYDDLGIRHVFPIHFMNNGFGGTAFQNPLVADPAIPELSAEELINRIKPLLYKVTTRQASDEGYDYRGGRVNIEGLTELGQFAVEAMMSKGMLIDVDHMSAASARDTLNIAERLNYPIVSGHTGFIDISNGEKLHEGNMKVEQLERIRRLGGMVACIINQGNLKDINTWRGLGQTVVTHTSGGTSETWAQAYLYAVEKMQGGPVGFGTDFNGMINPTGPRFGTEANPGGVPDFPGGFIGPTNFVSYPFRAIATEIEMDRSVVGNKVFSINEDGLAHIGMLPDFIADLQQIGLSEPDLASLLNSAEGYIQMWEKAERQKPNLPALPFSGTPSWCRRGGGFFQTEDNDLISFHIEPNVIGADAVEFVLELAPLLTWRKELILVTDDGQWTIAVQDILRSARNGLYRYQLPNGRLLFRKEKGLLGGGMRQFLELAQLNDLPNGARVTFKWIID